MSKKEQSSTADMWYTLNNLSETLRLELEKKVKELDKQLPHAPTELPDEIVDAIQLRAAQKFKKLKPIATFLVTLEAAGITYEVNTWWTYHNSDIDFAVKGSVATVSCNLDFRLAKEMFASLDKPVLIPVSLLPAERKAYTARLALSHELSGQIEQLNARIRNLENEAGKGRGFKALLCELAAENGTALPKRIKELITELTTQLATFIESQISKKKD